MDENEVRQETLKHIEKVRELLYKVIHRLSSRAGLHDKTKLGPEELPIFLEYTSKLKGCTYGSDEYKQFLAEMKPALDHHYANNRHHPEHFQRGIAEMDLIDIVEMFCDWLAATQRHADGNIYASIDINQKRFGYSEDLKAIFFNTAKVFIEKE